MSFKLSGVEIQIELEGGCIGRGGDRHVNYPKQQHQSFKYISKLAELYENCQEKVLR